PSARSPARPGGKGPCPSWDSGRGHRRAGSPASAPDAPVGPGVHTSTTRGVRMHRRPARTTVVAPLLVAMALGLGACGGDDEPTDTPTPTETSSATETPSPSESPSDNAPEADVSLTFEGGAWTPNGVRVEGKVGEPVTVEI